MQTALAQRIDQLVECGWEPVTTTETSAGRPPGESGVAASIIVALAPSAGRSTRERRPSAGGSPGQSGGRKASWIRPARASAQERARREWST